MSAFQIEGPGGGGLYDAYALVRDQKANGTDGGSAVGTTQTRRALNTVVSDVAGIVSLASDKITLGAGDYQIRAAAPFYNTKRSKIRLRNETAGTTLLVGTNGYIGGDSSQDQLAMIWSEVVGRFTVAAAQELSIQYWLESAGPANLALGVATSSGDVEVYTQVELWRYAA
jgi:hypothetical protein